MVDTSRRGVLRATGAVAVSGLAGCLARQFGDETEPPDTPGDATPDGSITKWERSTNCERTPSGMYDSVIEVEQVATAIGEGYVPIQFSELSPEETELLRTVTDEGGYGTCDSSNGFDRFVARVSSHREKQRDTAEEPMHVYLDRAGTYYRLYVEQQDQVFAY